jgi:hypothetical protein
VQRAEGGDAGIGDEREEKILRRVRGGESPVELAKRYRD